jgi:hypothetical protein
MEEDESGEEDWDKGERSCHLLREDLIRWRDLVSMDEF